MKYFELIIEYPVLVIILLIIMLIFYRDKFSFLISTPEKTLTKLLQSKENKETLKNPLLNDFLDNEIEKIHFLHITGLKFTENNKKLLTLYKPLSQSISWKEFKYVSKYITNYENYELISTKKLKLSYYSKMFLCVLFMVFSLATIMFLNLKSQNMDLKKLNTLIPSYLFFGISQIYLMNTYKRFKVIKKYNKLISKKIPN